MFDKIEKDSIKIYQFLSKKEPFWKKQHDTDYPYSEMDSWDVGIPLEFVVLQKRR